MKIQTRYRDVDWEEIEKAHGPQAHDRPDWWAKLRGSQLVIETPPIVGPPWSCREPHYPIVGGHPFKDAKACVCPHMAEIGD